MPINGTVQATGEFAPSSSGDTYAILDAKYMRDGFRNVDTIADLDLITEDRRTAGMVVGVSGGTTYYKLGTQPWLYTISDWSVFSSGGGGSDIYWVSGTSGNYSVKTINNSGLDATGDYALAEGNSTLAYGISSHAEGSYTVASGISSHAEGSYTKALGDYSHAGGSGTTAMTHSSFVHGVDAYANASETLDVQTPISILSAITITLSDPNYSLPAVVFSGNVSNEWNGYLWSFCSEFLLDNTSGTTQLVNVGCGAYDLYYDSGTNSTYLVDTTISASTYTIISGNSFYNVSTYFSRPAFAIGTNVKALGVNSYAEGKNATASRTSSHAEGENNYAGANGFRAATPVVNGLITIDSSYGDVTSAFTINNTCVILDRSFGNTFGVRTSNVSAVTFSTNTLVQLNDTTANNAGGCYIVNLNNINDPSADIVLGNYSHVEGNESKAFGEASHAEGHGTIASGSYSHAEGNSTISSGSYSHAEGYQTTAVSNFTHAEGIGTTALGQRSHAEGSNTISEGVASHAEGQLTWALGGSSHAEGLSTTAEGNYSHSEGQQTTAIGVVSHVGGYVNEVRSNYSFIGSGSGNTIYSASTFSFIGGGVNNTIFNAPAPSDSSYSFIGGGELNRIGSFSRYSSILGGYNNVITGSTSSSQYTAILGGSNNTLLGETTNSIIIGGDNNIFGDGSGVATTWYSLLFGRDNSGATNYSSIIGNDNTFAGDNLRIYGTNNQVNGNNCGVIGLSNSLNANNSYIIGNFLSGNYDNTVYVPQLNINILGTGSSVYNLGIDSNGFVVTGSTGGGTPALSAVTAVGNTTTDDIEITDFTKGVILRSPDNTRWRITVDSSGALITTAI